MAENYEAKRVIPDVPDVLPSEQIFVYVPVTDGTIPGLVKFNLQDFVVLAGEVSIKNGSVDYNKLNSLIASRIQHAVQEGESIFVGGGNISVARQDGLGGNLFVQGGDLHVTKGSDGQGGTLYADVFDIGSFMATLNHTLRAGSKVFDNTQDVEFTKADIGLGNVTNEDANTLVEALRTAIMSLIPAQATAYNKLADKNFVNSSIQTQTAFFRGNYESWEDVPMAGADYLDGKPTHNDYMVVRDVSDYPDPSENPIEGTWRFKFNGYEYDDQDFDGKGKSSWEPEYQVNETPMTAEQIAAIGSGITSALVQTFIAYASQIAGKLDKNTSVTNVWQVYAKNTNGTNIMVDMDSTYWSPNTVAMRVSDGNILVASTPAHNNHATSKGYVDSNLLNKVDKDYLENSFIQQVTI